MNQLHTARLCFTLMLFTTSILSLADDDNNKINYKLTLSHYDTETIHANDINLRISKDNQTLWLGYYAENPSHFDQARAGYERTDQLPYTNLVSNLQIASYGFFGFSTTAQIGDPFYVIIGYGRTNLKPYSNLNFDSNDAITYGIGWHKDALNLSLYTVQDNRVISGQRTTHFLARVPFKGKNTMVLDVYNKSGPNDSNGLSINATGASLTYNWSNYFARYAYDPKVNFTQEYMNRFSIGMRF